MASKMKFLEEWPTAAYHPQCITAYAGNPFIEALPPILDDAEAIASMQNLIRPSAEELELPAHYRTHLLERVGKEFVQPLEFHIVLFRRMSVLLRAGYVDRDPTTAKFLTDLNEAAEGLTVGPVPNSGPQRGRHKAGTRQRLGGGSGLTLIGSSGVGKTHAVEAILRSYDQVIFHPQLEGPLSAVFQIVYLKLSVPQDGGLKALCLDFLENVDNLIGTTYYKQFVSASVSIDKLIIIMGRISFLHGLGLLVIDELQNLSVAKSGGAEKMMNYFKQLRDDMKVPVLLIGTPEALGVLSGDLQVARRNAGLPPMQRMSNDEEFSLFCESLFDAQYLRQPMELQRSTTARLHWLSQGIADVVVKIFLGGQRLALSRGQERMDEELLQEVYETDLVFLHPFLDDIRVGKSVDAKLFDEALKHPQSPERISRPEPDRNQPGTGTASEPEGGTPIVNGVKPRRTRRRAKEPSKCILVTVVEEGVNDGKSPHRALFENGFIRELGEEILGQGYP